jgi:tripartite-type tricarboxylate transporter receptor subunit TctC
VFGLVSAPLAWSQYPSKPVKLIVSAAPGSSPDMAARLIAQKLSAKWPQPVVVEDLPGAGGNLAAERVAKSPADGHTVLFASAAVLYFNKALYPKLSYDIDKDLIPVIRVSRTPNLLVVPANSPIQSIQQLVQMAQSRPGSLRFGSGGSGSSMHVLAEVFAEKAHVQFEHIPYKSSSQMVQELMGEQIDFAFHNIAVVMPFVKSGKLRALAVTSDQRFFLDPSIATVKESGWPVVWEGGSGLLMAAGTSPDIVNRWAQDVAEVLALRDVQATLRTNGMEAAALKTSDFKHSIQDVASQWQGVLKKSRAKVD